MAWKSHCKRSVSCGDYENVLNARGGFFIGPEQLFRGIVKGFMYGAPLVGATFHAHKQGTLKKDVKSLYKAATAMGRGVRRKRRNINKKRAGFGLRQTRNGLQRGKNN